MPSGFLLSGPGLVTVLGFLWWLWLLVVVAWCWLPAVSVWGCAVFAFLVAALAAAAAVVVGAWWWPVGADWLQDC